MGRENYLFAGSHDGAKREEIVNSLTASCKKNSVNRVKDIPDIDHYAINKLEDLLPQNWMKLYDAVN